jgi:hypothetical protein
MRHFQFLYSFFADFSYTTSFLGFFLHSKLFANFFLKSSHGLTGRRCRKLDTAVPLWAHARLGVVGEEHTRTRDGRKLELRSTTLTL